MGWFSDDEEKHTDWLGREVTVKTDFLGNKETTRDGLFWGEVAQDYKVEDTGGKKKDEGTKILGIKL